MESPPRATDAVQSTPDLQAKASPSRSGFIPGVDMMRFIAAMWVAFGHGARFPVDQLLSKHEGGLALMAIGVSNTFFNGAEAVVVFFIISGLCIHFPNVNSSKIDIRTFLVRRLTRISIPIILALFICVLLGISYVGSLSAVLWSLYCEIIYYIIYPILYNLSKLINWQNILIISTLVSIVLRLVYLKDFYLWSFGALTWLYCLPAWVVGVLLAERVAAGSLPTSTRLWLWRGAAMLQGFVADVAGSHFPILIGISWLAPTFAVFCYFWLPRELAHWREGAPPIWEKLGLISYSIYLTHKIVLTFFDSRFLRLGPVVHWALQLSAMLAVAYIFYRLVERPSHLLARRLAVGGHPFREPIPSANVTEPIV